MAKLLTFIAGVVLWLLRKAHIIPDTPQAVDVRGRLFMPLFIRHPDTKVTGSWEYLSRNAARQKEIRDYIKCNAVSGETPAIALCLSPNDIAGGIWLQFPDRLDETRLPWLVERLEELCRDKIAVFATLYVDDAAPRWTDLAQHTEGWSRLWEHIRPCVSGCLVSIEQNEKARTRQQIEATIESMKAVMPGAQLYGTHLQFHGAGAGYCWRGGGETPRNADIILMEASWNPDAGDRMGVQGVQSQHVMMMDSGIVRERVVWHEYNLNAGGSIESEQRAYLRGCGLKGVG